MHYISFKNKQVEAWAASVSMVSRKTTDCARQQQGANPCTHRIVFNQLVEDPSRLLGLSARHHPSMLPSS